MKKWIVLSDLVTEIKAVCWIEAGMHVNEYLYIVAQCFSDGLYLLNAVLDSAFRFKGPSVCTVSQAPSDELPPGCVRLFTIFNECVNGAAAVMRVADDFISACVRLTAHRPGR